MQREAMPTAQMTPFVIAGKDRKVVQSSGKQAHVAQAGVSFL